MDRLAQKIFETIPQEDKERAASNVEHADDGCWHSASLALRLMGDYPDSVMACYAAVAKLYPVSKDTIRERVRIWRVAADHVKDYPNMLYSHWRAAVGVYAEKGLDGVLDIASQFEASCAAFGDSPSVDTVRSWVDEMINGREPIMYPVSWQRFERGRDLIAAAIDDEQFPSRGYVAALLEQLRQVKYGRNV